MARGIPGKADSVDHQTDAVGKAIEMFGSLDLLVNNAGINPWYGPMINMDLGAARKVVEVNCLAALSWTQLAYRAWMGSAGGAVVNVASHSALLPAPGVGMYGASKAMLVAMTKVLAVELGPAVRVNAVAPAVVKTRFAAALYEEREAEVAANYPLKRLGVPRDVGGAVAFLLSDESRLMNGQVLVVDGGVTLRGGIASWVLRRFLSGELGDPPGGWPEPFRTKALQGCSTRPAVTELDDADLAGLTADTRRTLNRLLFPGPTQDFEATRTQYGDLSAVPTEAFLYGMRQDGAETEVEISEGKLLLFGIEAVGEPDDRGIRNVLGTINGQLRPTEVRDRSVDSKVTTAEKADTTNPQHVAVPFAGVVHALVAEGDTVQPGQTVATIEAVKMEASISTPNAGTIARLVIAEARQAEGGDLLLELYWPGR